MDQEPKINMFKKLSMSRTHKSASVYYIELGKKDRDMLIWYVKEKGMLNFRGKPLSVTDSIESMTKCFIEDTIKPMYLEKRDKIILLDIEGDKQ